MTQQQKIVELLSDGNRHNFRELNDICFRYGARIFDLRKQGYVIKEEKENGVFWYWMEKMPEVREFCEPLPPNPQEVLF